MIFLPALMECVLIVHDRRHPYLQVETEWHSNAFLIIDTERGS